MPGESGTAEIRYRRVVLKISGEGFCHGQERGIAMDAVLHLAGAEPVVPPVLAVLEDHLGWNTNGVDRGG